MSLLATAKIPMLLKECASGSIDVQVQLGGRSHGGAFGIYSRHGVSLVLDHAPVQHVPPGTEACVSFRIAGRMCVFLSRVRRAGPRRLELLLPEEVACLQMRRSDRIPVSARAGLRVQVRSGRTVYVPDAVDISLGGVGLDFVGQAPLRKGADVDVTLSLYGEEVSLPCKVVHVAGSLVGIAFTGLDQRNAPVMTRIVCELENDWLLVA